MEKPQKLLILLGILMIFNFALILAEDVPSQPQTFRGAVQLINGGVNYNLPTGSTLVAYIEGVSAGSSTIPYSLNYAYLVSVGTGSEVGKTVIFKVGNMFVDQTYTYSAGSITNLNLTITDYDNDSYSVGYSGYTGSLKDCNDNNANVNPGASETCDGIDNDCDSSIDEGVMNTYYGDADGDNYGNLSNTTSACSAPARYVSSSSDCNDVNPSIHPGVTETTDGVDNNCDNSIDENLEDTEQYAEEENVTVGANTSDIIFNSGSSAVEKIIIPSTIASDKEINLDMSALLSSSNVSVGGDIILERQTTAINYTATIFSGTVISGNSTWDGILELPQVSNLTSDLGTVNTVIQIGASQRLNFSDAVKVVLGGMTGKKALWSDSTGTYAINVCSNANSSSPGSLTSGECYIDDGTDLIVWTYHFTKFGAYTPTSSGGGSSGGSSGGGGGGSCYTNWTCTSWGSCVDGIQTRTCAKTKAFCSTREIKPIESQSCTVLENESNSAEEEVPATEYSESNIRGITGFAVVGEAVTSTVGIIVLVVIGLIIISLIIINISKKKKSKREKF